MGNKHYELDLNTALKQNKTKHQIDAPDLSLDLGRQEHRRGKSGLTALGRVVEVSGDTGGMKTSSSQRWDGLWRFPVPSSSSTLLSAGSAEGNGSLPPGAPSSSKLCGPEGFSVTGDSGSRSQREAGGGRGRLGQGRAANRFFKDSAADASDTSFKRRSRNK